MSSKDNADYLLQSAINAGITDKKELANFMGQMQVECGGFSHMSEQLGYSGQRLLEVFPGRNGLKDIKQADAIAAGGPEAVANAIYGGEWGKSPRHLGNTEPGDGWKYHGRGYVQLTGRANYAQVGKEVGLDLVNHPELAENRENAAKIAIHYWQSRVVPHGHQKDVEGACLDINGGENGLSDRKKAAAAWQDKLDHGYIPGASRAAADSKHETDKIPRQGVIEMQKNLIVLGYTGANGHALKADGDFGPNTKSAVEAFQRDHHLVVDGIAGPKTLEAIRHPAQASKVPGLDNAANPDHGLYLQAQKAVHELDAHLGRTPDQQSNNLAAALTVAAKHQGMIRIDQVALSDDGANAFAVQLGTLKYTAQVQTATAVNTPIAQSSQALRPTVTRQTAQAQTQSPAHVPSQTPPAMSI